jgi:hypothetical protein
MDGWEADAFDEGVYDYSELEAASFVGVSFVDDVEKEASDGQWLASPTVKVEKLELSDGGGSTAVEPAPRIGSRSEPMVRL